jgi:hypothetical protein
MVLTWPSGYDCSRSRETGAEEDSTDSLSSSQAESDVSTRRAVIAHY